MCCYVSLEEGNRLQRWPNLSHQGADLIGGGAFPCHAGACTRPQSEAASAKPSPSTGWDAAAVLGTAKCKRTERVGEKMEHRRSILGWNGIASNYTLNPRFLCAGLAHKRTHELINNKSILSATTSTWMKDGHLNLHSSLMNRQAPILSTQRLRADRLSRLGGVDGSRAMGAMASRPGCGALSFIPRIAFSNAMEIMDIFLRLRQ